MKSLLYPAIALMNRLSFGMKFSLISIMFFLPMLVTNYYLVRDSYAQFHATQVELQSLELLRSSLALRGDVEALSNLVQINAVLGQSGKAGDVEKQISGLEQQVQRQLSGLNAVNADEAQAQAFQAKRDEMLVQLDTARKETSLLSKAALLDKLVAQSQVLSKVVASQAGLNQDSDSAIRQLTELMTTVTPEVTQTLGEGRAMGAYSLGQGFLNSSSSSRFEDLLQRLDKLAADYALRLEDALATDPGVRAH
ncbi:MAG: methyl-accepting chemotaxis protein, partial [Pseudomonas sp.]